MWKSYNPWALGALLVRVKYAHFFATGVSGLALALGTTYLLTELVFGLERYYEAYLIGLAANLVYNFTLHTLVTFKTKERHVQRFVIFASYSLALSALQALLVKKLTPIVGLDRYLLVIGTIVLTFSTVSFLVFKLSMFKEARSRA
jgi:putative flippase GtrA